MIAQVLIDFNDSHLYFIPPSTNLRVEYGWQMLMVGDKCFVTSVKPKSDAEAKGLKVGDQIISVEGFRPNKKEFWKISYYYNLLSIRGGLKLTVISAGESQPRELNIKSDIEKQPNIITFQVYYRLFDSNYNEENDKHRFVTVGKTVVWKMPSFGIDPKQVGSLVSSARKGDSMILDLRGNGGGYVKTLENLTGYFFDKDIKIADLKGRKKMDPVIAKTVGANAFKGKLIVLIDSNSASASEMFARVVQLEKRGIVLGDTSSGSVMQSRSHQGQMGGDNIIIYNVSITNADVLLSDGKSIEHIGVIPDETILPSSTDLANQRDPVLARAFEILGEKISAEQAGKFFKYYWK